MLPSKTVVEEAFIKPQDLEFEYEHTFEEFLEEIN